MPCAAVNKLQLPLPAVAAALATAPSLNTPAAPQTSQINSNPANPARPLPQLLDLPRMSSQELLQQAADAQEYARAVSTTSSENPYLLLSVALKHQPLLNDCAALCGVGHCRRSLLGTCQAVEAWVNSRSARTETRDQLSSHMQLSCQAWQICLVLWQSLQSLQL